MTSYAYEILIDDSEMIMLTAALELMIDHCQKKIDEGEGAPYISHMHSAESVLKKLYNNIIQVSGNNFSDNK